VKGKVTQAPKLLLTPGTRRPVSPAIVSLFAETRAALAQARRTGRATAAQVRAAIDELDDRYAQLELVEIDDVLVRQAGELTDSHGLRGYDAVHLAAARRVLDADLVLVAGDRALLAAAESLGLAVATID
jgi:predicted nucleic acid-binding protein